MTTARTSWRSAASRVCVAHAVSSAITCSLNALRTSGRLRVSRSTAPSRCDIRCVYVMAAWTTKTPRHEDDHQEDNGLVFFVSSLSLGVLVVASSSQKKNAELRRRDRCVERG